MRVGRRPGPRRAISCENPAVRMLGDRWRTGGWGDRRASRLGPAALVLALLIRAAVARAEGQDGPMFAAAQVRYDEGMSLYAARAFSAAAQAFHAAYVIDPRREILFAEAQATRLGGDCPTAIGLYQAFLATAPPAQQIEATRLALGRCHEPTPVAAPGPVAPPFVAPVISPPGRAAPAFVPHRRWWRDPAGLSLGAAAIVSWSAAIGLALAAARADTQAQEAPNYQEFEARRGVAEDRAHWGQRAAVVGALFTAAATSRFLWVGLARATPVAGVEGRF
jgi:hypothetical protein